MNNKSIKKNYIYNLSYQVLVLLTPLITTPYISRIIGADGIGEYSFANSIVSYFTLFAAMGIPTYGQREISYVQNDIEKRTIVFWNVKILEIITSSIALILYIFFSVKQENATIYLILALSIISEMFNVSWFFSGMEEFGKIVFRNVIVKVINIGYIFSFVKSKEDLLIYIFGVVGFGMISNLSLWFYLPQYIRFPQVEYIKPFGQIKTVLSLFVPNIATQIYTVFDKTMIGVITQNAFENGYYEQSLKISKMLLTVITALGTVMIPRIGYHFKQNNTDEIEKLMYRGYRFVWFLGVPLCFGLIAVSSLFVPWFFGSGYDKVGILLSILSFLIIAIGISNVTGLQYLMPTGRQNLLSISVIFGAVVNFCLNCVLITKYASIGAAVASVIAEFTVTIVQLFSVRKELSIKIIFRQGVNYYIAGAIMLGILFIIKPCFSATIISTFLFVGIGAVVYFIALILMKDEFLLSNTKTIIDRMLGKLKNKG